MPVPCLLVVVSFVVLFVGAELLVRGGAAVALRLGLTPLVVGLTVVAYGTSAPELVVSLKAAISGPSGIAIGNVVGSNIFNIALILGLTAVLCPIRTHLQVLGWDAPVLLVVTLLVSFLFTGKRLSRWEGLVLLACFGSYLITIRRRKGWL